LRPYLLNDDTAEAVANKKDTSPLCGVSIMVRGDRHIRIHGLASFSVDELSWMASRRRFVSAERPSAERNLVFVPIPNSANSKMRASGSRLRRI
jgi:hypothetical protein